MSRARGDMWGLGDALGCCVRLWIPKKGKLLAYVGHSSGSGSDPTERETEWNILHGKAFFGVCEFFGHERASVRFNAFRGLRAEQSSRSGPGRDVCL